MRVLGGAAAVAVLMLTLTGCGSQATRPTTTPTVTVAPSTTPSSAPTPTVTATATATGTPEPTATPVGTDPNRPKGQCPDSDLGVAIATAPGGGGAGSEYYDVVFTNTGGSSCVLRGAPGVSVVGGGNGTQIGAAADRSQSGATDLTLAVGASVYAPLRVVNIADGGGPLGAKCAVKKGDGYRVYPPHSKRAFFVQDPKAVACSAGGSFMTVGSVQRTMQ